MIAQDDLVERLAPVRSGGRLQEATDTFLAKERTGAHEALDHASQRAVIPSYKRERYIGANGPRDAGARKASRYGGSLGSVTGQVKKATGEVGACSCPRDRVPQLRV